MLRRMSSSATPGLSPHRLYESEKMIKTFQSNDSGWKRIISYYKPWYGNLGIALFSFLNTFGFMMIGAFVAAMLIIF